jgi:hypothetical protein
MKKETDITHSEKNRPCLRIHIESQTTSIQLPLLEYESWQAHSMFRMHILTSRPSQELPTKSGGTKFLT